MSWNGEIPLSGGLKVASQREFFISPLSLAHAGLYHNQFIECSYSVSPSVLVLFVLFLFRVEMIKISIIGIF